MSKPTFIFDLDGVITKTENYHFLAWKETCKELGYDLSISENEQLKGVGRKESLEKIINWSNITLKPEEFETILIKKNNLYLEYISQINSKNIFSGVKEFLISAKSKNHLIALYSASKNAKHILNKLEIFGFFDVIIDGNEVINSKPHPEGFIMAANLTNTLPENCVVFEDSIAGVEGANSINMYTIGIGDKKDLKNANKVYQNFNQFSLKEFTE
jgi:beta-phosphoglucomutase